MGRVKTQEERIAKIIRRRNNQDTEIQAPTPNGMRQTNHNKSRHNKALKAINELARQKMMRQKIG